MIFWLALALWALVPWRLIQFLLLFYVFLFGFRKIYAFIVLRGFRLYRQENILRSHQGKKLAVKIEIENRSFLPVLGVSINDQCFPLESDGHHRRLVYLAPRERRVIRYRVKGRERGEFSLGPIHNEILLPFKSEGYHFDDYSSSQVIIYPKLHETIFSPKRGLPMGLLKSKNQIDEDITRHRSIRNYQSGDEFKRINWKASAKAGQFLTNEYEASLDSGLIIVLNNRLADYPMKHRYLEFELAVEASASLAFAAANAGQAVQLAFFDKDFKPVSIATNSSNSRGVLDTLARLAAPQEKDSTLITELIPKIGFRSTLAYIGPFLEKEIDYFVHRCEQTTGNPILILINASRDNLNLYRSKKIQSWALEEVFDTSTKK